MTIQVNKYRPDVYRDDDSLGSTIVIGRYELYPTENIWTFLMQDVIDGHTYMVQWGFEEESRFIELIDSEKFK